MVAAMFANEKHGCPLKSENVEVIRFVRDHIEKGLSSDFKGIYYEI